MKTNYYIIQAVDRQWSLPKWNKVRTVHICVGPFIDIAEIRHGHNVALQLGWRWHKGRWFLFLTFEISHSGICKSAIEHTRYTAIAQLHFSHTNDVIVLII